MGSLFRSTSRHLARSIVLCCLLMAVPVYGLSGTIVQLLGSAHYHRPAAAADPMAGWQDFRRADAGGAAHLHPHPHGHTHSIFQRHHHDSEDDSVVSLDGGTSHDGLPGDGPATAGSACHTLAPGESFMLTFVPGMAEASWHALHDVSVSTRAPDRLERPPKA